MSYEGPVNVPYGESDYIQLYGKNRANSTSCTPEEGSQSPGETHLLHSKDVIQNLMQSPWVKQYRSVCAEMSRGMIDQPEEFSFESFQNDRIHTRSPQCLTVGQKVFSFLRGAFRRNSGVATSELGSMGRVKQPIKCVNQMKKDFMSRKKESQPSSSLLDQTKIWRSAPRWIGKKQLASSTLVNRESSDRRCKTKRPALFSIRHSASRSVDLTTKRAGPGTVRFRPTASVPLDQCNSQNSTPTSRPSALITARSPAEKDGTTKRTRFSLHPSTCNAPPELLRPRLDSEDTANSVSSLADSSYKSIKSSSAIRNETLTCGDTVVHDRSPSVVDSVTQKPNVDVYDVLAGPLERHPVKQPRAALKSSLKSTVNNCIRPIEPVSVSDPNCVNLFQRNSPVLSADQKRVLGWASSHTTPIVKVTPTWSNTATTTMTHPQTRRENYSTRVTPTECKKVTFELGNSHSLPSTPVNTNLSVTPTTSPDLSMHATTDRDERVCYSSLESHEIHIDNKHLDGRQCTTTTASGTVLKRPPRPGLSSPTGRPVQHSTALFTNSRRVSNPRNVKRGVVSCRFKRHRNLISDLNQIYRNYAAPYEVTRELVDDMCHDRLTAIARTLLNASNSNRVLNPSVGSKQESSHRRLDNQKELFSHMPVGTLAKTSGDDSKLVTRTEVAAEPVKQTSWRVRTASSNFPMEQSDSEPIRDSRLPESSNSEMSPSARGFVHHISGGDQTSSVKRSLSAGSESASSSFLNTSITTKTQPDCPTGSEGRSEAHQSLKQHIEARPVERGVQFGGINCCPLDPITSSGSILQDDAQTSNPSDSKGNEGILGHLSVPHVTVKENTEADDCLSVRPMVHSPLPVSADSPRIQLDAIIGEPIVVQSAMIPVAVEQTASKLKVGRLEQLSTTGLWNQLHQTLIDPNSMVHVDTSRRKEVEPPLPDTATSDTVDTPSRCYLNPTERNTDCTGLSEPSLSPLSIPEDIANIPWTRAKLVVLRGDAVHSVDAASSTSTALLFRCHVAHMATQTEFDPTSELEKYSFSSSTCFQSPNTLLLTPVEDRRLLQDALPTQLERNRCKNRSTGAPVNQRQYIRSGNTSTVVAVQTDSVSDSIPSYGSVAVENSENQGISHQNTFIANQVRKPCSHKFNEILEKEITNDGSDMRRSLTDQASPIGDAARTLSYPAIQSSNKTSFTLTAHRNQPRSVSYRSLDRIERSYNGQCHSLGRLKLSTQEREDSSPDWDAHSEYGSSYTGIRVKGIPIGMRPTTRNQRVSSTNDLEPEVKPRRNVAFLVHQGRAQNIRRQKWTSIFHDMDTELSDADISSSVSSPRNPRMNTMSSRGSCYVTGSLKLPAHTGKSETISRKKHAYSSHTTLRNTTPPELKRHSSAPQLPGRSGMRTNWNSTSSTPIKQSHPALITASYPSSFPHYHPKIHPHSNPHVHSQHRFKNPSQHSNGLCGSREEFGSRLSNPTVPRLLTRSKNAKQLNAYSEDIHRVYRSGSSLSYLSPQFPRPRRRAPQLTKKRSTLSVTTMDGTSLGSTSSMKLSGVSAHEIGANSLRNGQSWKGWRRIDPTFPRSSERYVVDDNLLRHTFASLQKVRTKAQQSVSNPSRPPMIFKR